MIEVGGGLLAVLADPREGMEAELDRWFDDEHLHERSAIDSVLFSRRYVSIEASVSRRVPAAPVAQARLSTSGFAT